MQQLRKQLPKATYNLSTARTWLDMFHMNSVVCICRLIIISGFYHKLHNRAKILFPKLRKTLVWRYQTWLECEDQYLIFSIYKNAFQKKSKLLYYSFTKPEVTEPFTRELPVTEEPFWGSSEGPKPSNSLCMVDAVPAMSREIKTKTKAKPDQPLLLEHTPPRRKGVSHCTAGAATSTARNIYHSSITDAPTSLVVSPHTTAPWKQTRDPQPEQNVLPHWWHF